MLNLPSQSGDTYLDCFEAAPLAIFLLDQRGQILHANQASFDLLGYDAGAVVGQPWAKFFAQADEAHTLLKQISVECTSAKNTLRSAQHTLLTNDLKPVSVLISANACYSGGTFKYNRLYVQDVSGSVLNDQPAQLAQAVLKVLVDAGSTAEAMEHLVPVLAAGLECDIGLVWRADEKANRLERLVLWRADAHADTAHLLNKSNNISLIVSSGFPADIWFSDRAHNLIADGKKMCCGSAISEGLPGYKQIISFPISIGRLNWGLFAFFSQTERKVDAALLALLEKIGEQIGRFVERQQALENYQKLQESYSLALAGANDGIWDWDLTTNEAYFSPRWKSLLEYEDHELENHFDTFRTLCHPDDYPLVMDGVHKHMTTREPYALECRMRTKGGDWRWISTRGNCTFNDLGQPVRMSGSHRDITDVKEAELARRRSELRLIESETKFKQLAENIREVFWIVTADRKQFTYVSPAFEEFWGSTCVELYKDAAIFFDSMVEADSSRIRDVLGGPIDACGLELEFCMLVGLGAPQKSAQGQEKSQRWIRARVFPICDEEGGRTHLCGIAHDITSIKEIEKHANQFYSTISHELRTPLTSIRAALGLIEAGLTGPIPDETLEYTKIARENSDRLIRLINDMLDIKKIEANHLELKISRLNVEAIIGQTIESLRPYAEQSGVTVIAPIQDEIADCIGDADRVVQILTNLISNAIKYTPTGKSVLVTASKLEQSPGFVRFSVQDQGKGIADHDRADLFGPFQQLSCIENEVNRGTGLGLAISKILVERQKGTIGLNSRIGEGAEFWFELPEADGLFDESVAVSANFSASTGRADDALVLVLEDSDSIALILKAVLSKNGYSVVRAATVAGAKELLQTIAPNMVLADVNLPDGSGLGFVDWMRATRQAVEHATIPVIILSGAEPDLTHLKTLKSIDWVRKPFDSEELLALLNKRMIRRAGQNR